MEPSKSRYIRALELALEIASKSVDAREKLERILNNAMDVVSAERGFLIVPTRKNPFAIHTAKNYGGLPVPEEQQQVSRELLQNAWDMSDTVVAVDPFGELVGTKGTYALKSDTLELIRDLRSVIAAPLVLEKRMVGALVLHERKRPSPFTLDDRRVLTPLAELAASVLGESARKVRDDLAAPLAPPKIKERARGLVGEAPSFVEFVARLEKVAPLSQTVLIQGETGTGKERAAELVHELSPRSKGPFVAVNVASFGPELLESELFGYAAGAFTGATKSKDGVASRANGGTLFLDEMGELAPPLQAKLLRFLQSKTIRPVGTTDERVLDVRIVAATNRDLERMVEEGRFQRDLFMRLAALRLQIPPLRERASDLRLLVPHVIERLVGEEGCERKALTNAAFAKLEAYDWPGNVRELENVIRAALVFGKRSVIDASDLDIREKTVTIEEEDGPTRKNADQWLALVDAARATKSREEVLERLDISLATFQRYLLLYRHFDPKKKLLPDWCWKHLRRS